MKNNILHRFAYQDLKTHRRDSILTMVTIFIVAIVIMTISLFTPYFLNQKTIEFQSVNGTFDYYTMTDIPISDINNMKLSIQGEQVSVDDSTLNKCLSYPVGMTLNNETINELEGNYEIILVQLQYGRMPQNKNEVAVKKSVLTKWGYPDVIDSQIKISYCEKSETIEEEGNYYSEWNGPVHVQEFTVVGFLEETGTTDIVVSNMKKDTAILYLDLDNGTVIDNIDDYSLLTDVATIDDGFLNSVMQRSGTLVFIEVAIIVIAVALLYGLTLSSFEKKQQDYTLLRSIGVTQRQTYYVIFIQSLLLGLLPTIIAMVCVYILSLIIPLFITFPFELPFQIGQMLWNVVTVLAIVFISYFIPARSASRKALTGAFDGQEFQYFYYRYKKLHKMRPFYLAWRQLVSLKKKMIIKIFLIALITVSSMGIIGESMINHSYNQDIYESFHTNSIEYILTNDEGYSKEINLDDFEALRPYVDNITYYHYKTSTDLTIMSLTGYGRSANFPDIYCINDELAQKYNIQNLQAGQIVLTNGYLNTIGEHLQVGDHISFIGDYEIIQIVDDAFQDIAILSETDYQSYGSLEKYQKVSVSFKDSQQKTNALLNCAEQFQHLKNKYMASDYTFTQSLSDNINQFLDNILNVGLWQRILFIICIAVIYIYQFSFELWKQREDIGTYQLLGLTKKEIWQIYFYKSFIISLIGLVAGGIYHFLDFYYTYQSLKYEAILFHPSTIIPTILIALLINVMIICISLIPLYGITKKDGLENKNTKE